MRLTRRGLLKMGLAWAAGGLLSACAAQADGLSEMEYRILAEGLDFPEGPAFAPDGSLWCTELNGGNLVRVAQGNVTRFASDGRPNGLAFDSQGRAWVCDSGQNAIRRFEPANGAWKTILDRLDGQALLAPNDLVFDVKGNLLFTCPNFANTEPRGYIACLSPAGNARKIGEGYYRPNGLEFVAGGKALAVADTYQKRLFRGTWDAARLAWQDPAPWAMVGGKEGPDGMACGADGLLYQAIYGDGVVRVIDAKGRVAREIKIPGQNPTNAAIDPSGKLGMVVTETEMGRLISFPGLRPGVALFQNASAWQ